MKSNIAIICNSASGTTCQNMSGAQEWVVHCPYCFGEMRYQGVFDLSHVYKCVLCQMNYKISGLYNMEGSQII